MNPPSTQATTRLHRLFRGATGRLRPFFVLLALLGAQLPDGAAEEVYQTPEAFLQESFGGEVPEPRALWLTGEAREGARRILGHAPPSIRVRYWQRGDRTAWILEEIGKEEPITTGFVVENGEIRRLRVLIYRESRGWEVRYPFFTEQFDGARLEPDQSLDRHIDNITGATLSVNALTRLARLALYYARLVSDRQNS